jgi:hypothetical protein
LGDDVFVEGEFGTIEEITLNYVVVKIWDERRLIVPVSRFLETPFQNRTKVSSQLHGTVILYADFGLPVNELRQELGRVLEQSQLWDKRTSVVHVTDTTDSRIEIRVLVSARSSGALFDLRAEVRERLVGWLSRFESGRYLPRVRLGPGATDAERALTWVETAKPATADAKRPAEASEHNGVTARP